MSQSPDKLDMIDRIRSRLGRELDKREREDLSRMTANQLFTVEHLMWCEQARDANTLRLRAAVVIGAMDRGVTDGSLIDSGWFEFLDEYDVRSLVCELLGHLPRCKTTDECYARLVVGVVDETTKERR